MAPTAEIMKIRVTVRDMWNTMVTQLGHWNPDNVACVDAVMFRDMSNVAKAGVLAEFA